MNLPEIPPRLPDWQPRLVAYLARVSAAPFAFGQHDCALFAAGAVEAMTGTDPAARWRGKYATAAQGLARLRRVGIADATDLCAQLFADVPVLMAAPGDLAVIDTPDGPAMGVVQGHLIYVLSQTTGRLGLVDLLAAKRCFKVI